MTKDKTIEVRPNVYRKLANRKPDDLSWSIWLERLVDQYDDDRMGAP